MQEDHPLRARRALIDGALASLDGLFDPHYADLGKAPVAPERLIRESILQVLCAIRNERRAWIADRSRGRTDAQELGPEGATALRGLPSGGEPPRPFRGGGDDANGPRRRA